MAIDSESVVDKVMPVLLGGDLENLNITVSSVESAIEDNHRDIVKWLENTGKIDAEVIANLKKELDI